jgi:hypothetical protein
MSTRLIPLTNILTRPLLSVRMLILSTQTRRDQAMQVEISKRTLNQLLLLANFSRDIIIGLLF